MDIYLEDIVGNAFIELSGIKFIPYKALKKYGEEVVEILNEQGIKAKLQLSRDLADQMLEGYSNIFSEVQTNEGLGILLVGRVDKKGLIEEFRGYTDMQLILAFMDQRALDKLV